LVVVASRSCLETKEIAQLDRILDDAYKGGMRVNKASGKLEQITNWDIQSTIFLALQVMGSVGKSTMSTVCIRDPNISFLTWKFPLGHVFRYLNVENLGLRLGVTVHWSERSLVRRVTGPNVHEIRYAVDSCLNSTAGAAFLSELEP